MNSQAISAASVSVGHGPGAGGNEGTAQDRGTAAPDSNLTGIDSPQEQPQAAREKDSANFSGGSTQSTSRPQPGGSGYVPSASSTGEEDPGANPDPEIPPRTDPSPLPDPPPSPQPPPPEIEPPPPMEDPQPGHELPVMPQPIATRA